MQGKGTECLSCDPGVRERFFSAKVMRSVVLLVIVLSFFGSLLWALAKDDGSKDSADDDVIFVGGIFEEKRLRDAFRAALETINDDDHVGLSSDLSPIIEAVGEDESFAAVSDACSLLSKGIAGVFGPQSSKSSNQINSLCSSLDVSHVELRPDTDDKTADISVNLYPDPDDLAEAFTSLMKHYHWTKIAVLYEDDDEYVQIKDLRQELQEDNIDVTPFKKEEGKSFRDVFKKIKQANIHNIVVAAEDTDAADILKEAMQVNMLNSNYGYLFLTLDFHSEDLDDYKYSRANITALRLVDINNNDLNDYFKKLRKYIGQEERDGAKAEDIDGDGIRNEDDEDMDGDGIKDEYDEDMDGDGVKDEDDSDMDGDGVSDEEDEDMDGDGIKDEVDDDMDGDGIRDEDDPDMDGDGVRNEEDEDKDGDGIKNEDDDDIDGDGIKNEDDEDLDGDGIKNEDDEDLDGDGVRNALDDDLDGDGIADEKDDDMDGDGIADEVDDDMDGDGVNDEDDDDIDGDGIKDEEDTDMDGDGISDDVDEDRDGDGIKNVDDEDQDGDGIRDEEDEDLDGDGIRNVEDEDQDGDGIKNTDDEDKNGDGIRESKKHHGDIDGDGIKDELDDDIDGDGIKDELDEDLDGDGIKDEDDEDLDGDGIKNEDDEDLDGDGVKNIDDEDIDGDGVDNENDDDVDGDGVKDSEDDDMDGDGIKDEIDDDMDGDGVKDEHDEDMDGDGVKNIDDEDIDGDGVKNEDDEDLDGDGIKNEDDEDRDGDGIVNEEDDDQDGDGIKNVEDDDVDGDGVKDEVDDDMDGDGIKDENDPDMDGDGLLDESDPDMDGDGVKDEEDDDMDGDGIADENDPDMDGDGIKDENDNDMDGDGLKDEDDPDMDGDGVKNEKDEDMDGDGIKDEDDPDMDGDGIADEDDPDMDGDGISDEDDPDLDGDGIPNEKDDDLDGDGVKNEEDDDHDGNGIKDSEEDTAEEIETEVALVYDAVKLFALGLKEYNKSHSLNFKAVDCQKKQKANTGISLKNIMKKTTFEGITGPVKFDKDGVRTDINLYVITLTADGLQEIGTWDSDKGLDIKDIVRDYDDEGESVKVSTIGSYPYVITKLDENNNTIFSGFCVDVMDELAARLNFRYKLQIVEDGYYGFEDSSGKWNGLIGEIIDGKADLAIGDITVTADREQVVDFTTPFMSTGLSVVYRVSDPGTRSIWAFFLPLTKEVWLYIFVAMFLTTLLLYIIGRLTGGPEEQEPTEKSFTFLNCIIFVFSTLVHQRMNLDPGATATRVLSGIWYFFTFIILVIVVSNLCESILWVDEGPHFEKVQDIMKVKGFKFGAIQGGSTVKYLQESQVPLHRNLYKLVENNLDNLPDSNSDGIEKVMEGKYAFIMEHASASYVAGNNCNLTHTDPFVFHSSYSIVTSKNNAFRNELSAELLRLQETGRLRWIRERWWNPKRPCAEGAEEEEDDSHQVQMRRLTAQDLAGAFAVLYIGLTVSLGLAFIEVFYVYATRDTRDTHLKTMPIAEHIIQAFYIWRPTLEVNDSYYTSSSA